ncbi:MAG: glycoside hydrolase family 15 protein, partial [Geodermatophilaceae bacterium]|nr:glycoside hydrolase family 15 protein [Geodermatophilaceae bacterium]
MAHPGATPWRQPDIAEYAFLSDSRSAALVSRAGSVDWWCPPRFDAPSVLGRLLDAEAGHWSLAPAAQSSTQRSYVGDSLVLRTVFRTATGQVTLTDALGLERGARGHDIGLRSPAVLLRRLYGDSGTVAMQGELIPRMEYGRTTPHVSAAPGGAVARGGPVRLAYYGPVTSLEDGAVRSTFSVAAGETVDLRLAYAPAFGPVPESGEPTIEDTTEAWESWAALHTAYAGPFPDQVRRSSLVLQGLTYQPSGAVVAAATTSLPEQMGGDLNFDYRFAWLRDLSLTIRSLWVAACPDEPSRLFDWFANAAGQVSSELVQIMYGVEGERDLTEHVLEHLSGYRASRPVRIGNQAWQQT